MADIEAMQWMVSTGVLDAAVEKHATILGQTIAERAQGSLDAALRVLEADPHQFSARPCSTCTAVTALAGRKFGCSRINGEAHGG